MKTNIDLDALQKAKFIGGINFDELRAQRVQLYNTIEIDLSIVRLNQEQVFTGTYIYALEATDVDANVNVRFNELFRNNINLVRGRGVRCPFYRIYLSNAAQAGKTLTLAIGIESGEFEIFDVGKALGITGTVDVDQVGGWVVPERPAASVQVAVSGHVENTTAVLYTVTAGKTLYLASANLHSYVAAGSLVGYGRIFVTNAADVEQYCVLDLRWYASSTSMVHHESWNTLVLLEIPEGFKVKVLASGGAAIHSYAFIQGYEK